MGHCLIQGAGGKLAQADRVPDILGFKANGFLASEYRLPGFPAAAPTAPQQLQGPGQVEMQGLEREVVHVGLPGATTSSHSLVQLLVQSFGIGVDHDGDSVLASEARRQFEPWTFSLPGLLGCLPGLPQPSMLVHLLL